MVYLKPASSLGCVRNWKFGSVEDLTIFLGIISQMRYEGHRENLSVISVNTYKPRCWVVFVEAAFGSLFDEIESKASGEESPPPQGPYR